MIRFRLLALGMAVTLFSCDDENSDPRSDQSLPAIGFNQTEIVFDEDELEGTLRLTLSKPAAGLGTVSLSFTSSDLTAFDIQPQPVNGKIDLVVNAGSTEVFFRVRPVNNGIIDGNKSLFISVVNTSGNLRLADNRSLSLTVVDDESPVKVNFMINMGSTRENATQSSPVMILLSGMAPTAGTIEINFIPSQLTYGVHFITEPAAQNGKIVIPVSTGELATNFKVIPINNQLVNGDHQIQFILSRATGGVTLGPGHLHVFTITDDEIMSLARGYQNQSGNYSHKREYTYNEDGSINEVRWESNTPNFRSGSFTYEYDELGRVQREVHNDGLLKVYTWKDDRIVKSEDIRNDEVKRYVIYGYDAAGRVGEMVLYDRQKVSDPFVVTFTRAYLYHADGNLFKEFLMAGDGVTVISTAVYDGYLPAPNPFPAVEILPNLSVQPNLPGSYKLNDGMSSLNYQFSYEFRADGLPVKRTVSGAAQENSTYHYY